jgi:hypothetical protein
MMPFAPHNRLTPPRAHRRFHVCVPCQAYKVAPAPLSPDPTTAGKSAHPHLGPLTHPGPQTSFPTSQPSEHHILHL